MEIVCPGSFKPLKLEISDAGSVIFTSQERKLGSVSDIRKDQKRFHAGAPSQIVEVLGSNAEASSNVEEASAAEQNPYAKHSIDRLHSLPLEGKMEIPVSDRSGK